MSTSVVDNQEGDAHGDEDAKAGGDVRLGAVVTSSDKNSGGVIVCDLGKKLTDGLFEVAYYFDYFPRALRVAMSGLQAEHEFRDEHILKYVDQMAGKLIIQLKVKWRHSGQPKDLIFPADCKHQGGKLCRSCDSQRAIKELSLSRSEITPDIHYDVIAPAPRL